MKRILSVAAAAFLCFGGMTVVFAGTGSVYNFSEPLNEEVRINCGEYVDLFFKGNYGTDTENLRVVTDTIDAIETQLDDSDIDYYDFVGTPKFATQVKVAIDADSESFLYQYIDGKIIRVPDVTYESDAWTFYTKKLGTYFITEEEYPEMDIG